MFGTLFFGARINYFAKGGLYQHSRNGYFLRFFHRFAGILGCHPEKLLAAKTLEEQAELYEKHIDPFFDSIVIRMIGKMPVTMFGLGIPPQQYEELKKDLAADGSIIDIYRERAKRLACDYPINENYFAWQAFARKYDTVNRDAVPDYLKEENYETVKRNAFKVSTSIGSVTDRIKQDPNETFNRFVFLDAQDWMNAEVMTDLWHTIADKAEPGSRIIFRTAGAESAIGKNLPPALQSRFEYQSELSAELFKQDRASIYGGFHLYVLNK
jgi:S-adenosylmethionine-diacylglycerol 3-amino-3-carboxypropyl transferase